MQDACLFSFFLFMFTSLLYCLTFCLLLFHNAIVWSCITIILEGLHDIGHVLFIFVFNPVLHLLPTDFLLPAVKEEKSLVKSSHHCCDKCGKHFPKMSNLKTHQRAIIPRAFLLAAAFFALFWATAASHWPRPFHWPGPFHWPRPTPSQKSPWDCPLVISRGSPWECVSWKWVKGSSTH